jgi:hypothetical protein
MRVQQPMLPEETSMQQDSPRTNAIMVAIFMSLVLALNALLTVMIAYGHNPIPVP